MRSRSRTSSRRRQAASSVESPFSGDRRPTNSAYPPSPRPIPKGTTINGVTFSFQPFGAGLEPASITDFHGFVGVADVQGTGTATYPDGSTETLLFDTDMRFMKGSYIAKDRRVHRGTFGFV